MMMMMDDDDDDLMPPQHLYGGLARSVDYSIVARPTGESMLAQEWTHCLSRTHGQRAGLWPAWTMLARDKHQDGKRDNRKDDGTDRVKTGIACGA